MIGVFMSYFIYLLAAWTVKKMVIDGLKCLMTLLLPKDTLLGIVKFFSSNSEFKSPWRSLWFLWGSVIIKSLILGSFKLLSELK